MDGVLTTLPLTELCAFDVEFRRGAQVDEDAVRDHLRGAEPVIAVAQIGSEVQYLSGTAAFDLWKRELRPRLVTGGKFFLDEFPDERAYVATRWTSAPGLTLVLFEQHH